MANPALPPAPTGCVPGCIACRDEAPVLRPDEVLAAGAPIGLPDEPWPLSFGRADWGGKSPMLTPTDDQRDRPQPGRPG